MNTAEVTKCALAVQRHLRAMHLALDNTPEMEDSRYLMLVSMMNEFRLELFSNLAMIGIEIPVSEREVAPDTASAVTKKRQWQGPQPNGKSPTMPVQSQQTNPFCKPDW